MSRGFVYDVRDCLRTSTGSGIGRRGDAGGRGDATDCADTDVADLGGECFQASLAGSARGLCCSVAAVQGLGRLTLSHSLSHLPRM